MDGLPAHIERLAAQQFGVVARAQLVPMAGRGAVDGLVQRGMLVPIQRGVYRVRGGAIGSEQRAMAAVLRARPGAVVTGPLVLALLEVDGFRRTDPFEVLTTPGRRLRGVDFPHRINPTPDATTARFGGLTIASPTAALVDAGRFRESLGDRRLRAGLDAARWRGLTTTQRVVERIEELGPGDPGARFWRDTAELGLLAPESEGERSLGALLDRVSPAAEPQVWVTPRRRVDWFYRRFRTAIEYLGGIDHGHAAALLRDRDREAELAALGIRVVPVVDRDLREPEGFLGWIGNVLAARAYELGVEPPAIS